MLNLQPGLKTISFPQCLSQIYSKLQFTNLGIIMGHSNAASSFPKLALWSVKYALNTLPANINIQLQGFLKKSHYNWAQQK